MVIRDKVDIDTFEKGEDKKLEQSETFSLVFPLVFPLKLRQQMAPKQWPEFRKEDFTGKKLFAAIVIENNCFCLKYVGFYKRQ